jgi:hypothetical protein
MSDPMNLTPKEQDARTGKGKIKSRGQENVGELGLSEESIYYREVAEGSRNLYKKQ